MNQFEQDMFLLEEFAAVARIGDSNDSVFGQHLRELRTKEGLTQKALAEKLDISAASVIAYEKGQKKPSIDVAAKIAKYFGVTIDSMVSSQWKDEVYERAYNRLEALMTQVHGQED